MLLYGDHLKDHSAACNLVLDALKCIPVACSKCGNEILLSEYTTHLESGCTFVSVTGNVRVILNCPVNQSLSLTSLQMVTGIGIRKHGRMLLSSVHT